MLQKKGRSEEIKESEYTYDQKFKQLFQNKKFLSPILKNVVKEYNALSLMEIEELIISVQQDDKPAADKSGARGL